MSFTYGFYNSKGGDRKYNAEQMSSIFDGIINDGIFANVGRVFATIPGEGLQIVVGSGRAWFNSTWSYNDAAFPIVLDPADPIQSRIDSVILEVDRTETVRRNRLLVLTGSPSSSPNPPVLKNTDLVHQHRLANITVTKDAKSINASNITNLVGTEECPFVTGILQTASIEDLFLSWNEQFTNWFEKVQSQLSGDVAGALLLEINQRLHKVDDKASSADMATLTDDTKWVSPAVLKPALENTVNRKHIASSIDNVGFCTRIYQYFAENNRTIDGHDILGSMVFLDVLDNDLFLYSASMKSPLESNAFKPYFILVNTNGNVLDTIRLHGFNSLDAWPIFTSPNIIVFNNSNTNRYIYSVKIINNHFSNYTSIAIDNGFELSEPSREYRRIRFGYAGYTPQYIRVGLYKSSGAIPLDNNGTILLNTETSVATYETYNNKLLIDNIQKALNLDYNLYTYITVTNVSQTTEFGSLNPSMNLYILRYWKETLVNGYSVGQHWVYNYFFMDGTTITPLELPSVEMVSILLPHIKNIYKVCGLKIDRTIENIPRLDENYMYVLANIEYIRRLTDTDYEFVSLGDKHLFVYTHDGKLVTTYPTIVQKIQFIDMNNVMLIRRMNRSWDQLRIKVVNGIIKDLTEEIPTIKVAIGSIFTNEIDNYPSKNLIGHVVGGSAVVSYFTHGDTMGSIWRTITPVTNDDLAPFATKFTGINLPLYISFKLNPFENDSNIGVYVLIERISMLGESLERNEVIENENR